MSLVYIASRDEMGGIYKYSFDGERYVEKNKFLMNNPMYMVESQGYMHVLLRAPFDNLESGYVSYRILENGDLETPSKIYSTKGEIACHLYAGNEGVYCVNYSSGSVIKIPDKLVVHKGEGQSHTHYVGKTPDGKYLCVTDLGLNKIFLYDESLRLINKTDMPNGSGVRHLIFDKNGYLFTANELDATVSALKYEKGILRLIDTVSCTPSQTKGFKAASAIRIYKGKIYVAIRGCDIISRLSFNENKLSLEESFSCEGKTPRDFDFDQNRLICCNQDSDTVTVFREDNEKFSLIQTINLKQPICVLTNRKEK